MTMSIFARSCALLVTLVTGSAIGLGDVTDDVNDTPSCGNAADCREYISKLEEQNVASRDGRFELAQALTDLAVLVGPSPERQDIYEKKNQVYEGLLNDFPNDPDILRTFAMTHEDDTATVHLLKRLLTLVPDDFGAHWILGLILTDSTDRAEIREGLRHYAHAYEFAPPHTKVGTGAEYILKFRNHGYQRRAAQFLDQMLDDLKFEELFSRASELLASDSLNPPTFPNALTELTDIVCHVEFMLVDRTRCESAFRLAVRLQQMFPNNTALARLLVSGFESINFGTSDPPDIDEASIRRAYGLAVRDEPDNLFLLRAYGSHLEVSEREEVLSRHINTYSATSAATQAELAELYWNNSEPEAAIQHMYRAFRHDAAVNRGQYGERLSTMLREIGRCAEADAVGSQMRPE